MSGHGPRGCRVRTASLVVVFIAAALIAGCSTPRKTGAPPGRLIGPLALGVNVAAWDSVYDGVHATSIARLLKSAGFRLIRYPGGSWADEYDWSTNTDTSNCTGVITSTCGAIDALGFGAFSTKTRAAGASTFATVNYGSGTPSEAATWVTRAATIKGETVALWEVGNETYSCYETNNHLGDAPTFITGYTPGGALCPSTARLARSYAADALPYLRAMKHANPAAKIGVPWAFNGDQAAGDGINNASLWNTKVLRALKTDISFVDAHWYPFDQVNGVSSQQILLSTRRIPAAAAQIRSTLRRDAPGSNFVIGETNISERVTNLDFQPVSALFAASTTLAWLSQGAESVDWWDLNNFGTPTGGDYGLISSGSPETAPAGVPFPSYYGEELASKLTSSGSHIKETGTGSVKLLGYQSERGHRREVLLVNTATSAVSSSSDRWFTSGSDLEALTYSASTANTTNPIARSTVVAGHALVLPPESIVVLSSTVGS
jgi:hypothetical protein